MRGVVFILLSLLFVASMPAQARAQTDAEFTDKNVERMIKRAAEFLWSQQRKDGRWDYPIGGRASRHYSVGLTSLVAYALLETGISPQDDRMLKALNYLAENETKHTYALGLRANVWLTAMRSNKKYHRRLRMDVLELVKGVGNGSYTYFCPATGTTVNTGARAGQLTYRYDNSNSQYGLLGVWAGRRGNIEVPREYWHKVMRHWLGDQQGDGGWNYIAATSGRSTHTMTAAGVASLFVCVDNLLAEAFVKCNMSKIPRAVQEGLDWFARNFKQTLGSLNCYYLYGVERVGLASGYKYFGTCDWYKMGTLQLMRTQRPDGAWPPGGRSMWGQANTGLALLFLARGRNPVLFNKLEFHGVTGECDWNNRPRDLATLTRWISRTFERTVNWQIINLQVPVREWHDAPILYISASKAPTFTKEQMDKLRKFALQGGTIFSCAECDGVGFKEGIRKVYADLFPKYEMLELPREHTIYSLYYKLRARPTLHMISNGIRPLVIHTDEDLSLRWQLRKVATERWAFNAAANIFMYVTDKGRLRHRGQRLWPVARELPDYAASATLARLKYGGNYDPEPLAYDRLTRLLAKDERIALKVIGPIDIEQLPKSNVKLAALTGTGKFGLTAGDRKILKDWISRGGTLLLDAAGGSKRFHQSATRLISQLFPNQPLRELAQSSPLLQITGKEIPKVSYHRASQQRLGRRTTVSLWAILSGQRLAVIYSREDLTAAGLVGYSTYGLAGYRPHSAYQIMRNIILHVCKPQAN